jgi:hypothetical protein
VDHYILDLVNFGDELQVAIRCHLAIEHHLINVIESELKYPNEFSTSKLNFRQKVELAIALGKIDKGMKGTFLSINKLRNQFAHDMHKKITEQEMDELYSTLNSQSREALGKTNYSEGDAISKFGGIFLVLYAYLTKEQAME